MRAHWQATNQKSPFLGPGWRPLPSWALACRCGGVGPGPEALQPIGPPQAARADQDKGEVTAWCQDVEGRGLPRLKSQPPPGPGHWSWDEWPQQHLPGRGRTPGALVRLASKTHFFEVSSLWPRSACPSCLIMCTPRQQALASPGQRATLLGPLPASAAPFLSATLTGPAALNACLWIAFSESARRRTYEPESQMCTEGATGLLQRGPRVAPLRR